MGKRTARHWVKADSQGRMCVTEIPCGTGNTVDLTLTLTLITKIPGGTGDIVKLLL